MRERQNLKTFGWSWIPCRTGIMADLDRARSAPCIILSSCGSRSASLRNGISTGQKQYWRRYQLHSLHRDIATALAASKSLPTPVAYPTAIGWRSSGEVGIDFDSGSHVAPAVRGATEDLEMGSAWNCEEMST